MKEELSMTDSQRFGIGVDLGGTKIGMALVSTSGEVLELTRMATDVHGGAEGVTRQIVGGVRELCRRAPMEPVGVGIGVAGQIEPGTGLVRFAPNLDWHDVPLKADLQTAVGMTVAVTNDVRAATWGEWLYGAGRGCEDMICMFVGTGIGGGIVTGGRILTGCSNTAGEIGHITINMNGPACTCGNRGCMEAIAGGWAIAQRTKEAISGHPRQGERLLALASGKREAITTRIVAEAALEGDLLATQIINEAAEALIAGAASLVNAFNPCRLILGGGVMEGLPHLVPQVEEGILRRALAAATEEFQVVPSALGNNAGAIGAAAYAMRSV